MYHEILETLSFFAKNGIGTYSEAFESTERKISKRDQERIKLIFQNDKLVEEEESSFGIEETFRITVSGQHFHKQVTAFQYYDAILTFLNKGHRSNFRTICSKLLIPYSDGYELQLINDQMVEVSATSKDGNEFRISSNGRNHLINQGGYVQMFLRKFEESIQEIKQENQSTSTTMPEPEKPNIYDQILYYLKQHHASHRYVDLLEEFKDHDAKVLRSYAQELATEKYIEIQAGGSASYGFYDAEYHQNKRLENALKGKLPEDGVKKRPLGKPTLKAKVTMKGLGYLQEKEQRNQTIGSIGHVGHMIIGNNNRHFEDKSTNNSVNTTTTNTTTNNTTTNKTTTKSNSRLQNVYWIVGMIGVAGGLLFSLNDLMSGKANDQLKHDVSPAVEIESNPKFLFNDIDEQTGIVQLTINNWGGHKPVENLTATIVDIESNAITKLGPIRIPIGEEYSEYIKVKTSSKNVVHLGIQFTTTRGNYQGQMIAEKLANGNWVQASSTTYIGMNERKNESYVKSRIDQGFPVDKWPVVQGWPDSPY